MKNQQENIDQHNEESSGTEKDVDYSHLMPSEEDDEKTFEIWDVVPGLYERFTRVNTKEDADSIINDMESWMKLNTDKHGYELVDFMFEYLRDNVESIPESILYNFNWDFSEEVAHSYYQQFRVIAFVRRNRIALSKIIG